MLYKNTKKVCFKSHVLRLNKRSTKPLKAKRPAKPSEVKCSTTPLKPPDSSIKSLKGYSILARCIHATHASHVECETSWEWQESLEWQESWQEFKKLGDAKHPLNSKDCTLANKNKTSIPLVHPFVPVIGNCAVDAFNSLLKKHARMGKSNNLCHHEVMECKYLKFSNLYSFYMTIEAIEEGILSVYDSIVACNPIDGRGRLIQFIHTNRRPSGNIAMKLPHLTRLKLKYSTLKVMKEDLEIKLGTASKSMEGADKKKSKVAPEFIRLKKQHKAMKGVCKELYWLIRSQIPKSWNQRSDDPDGWWDCEYRTCGMKKRSIKATCKGIDYYSQSPGDSVCNW